MTNLLLPLEKQLQELATRSSDSFPRMPGNYFTQYNELVNQLKLEYYSKIDAGLSANSPDHSFYTAHNSEHFDEVVRYAGELISKSPTSESFKLQPYEIYVLLVAIRIHDVGNVLGREEHEKKCFFILKNCHAGGANDVEKKKIASIAQAHGGKTIWGDKDTIGALDERNSIGSIVIRPRLLAALVRFADEVCENSSRATDLNAIPDQSKIYHAYAGAITGNSFDGKWINLEFMVSQTLATETLNSYTYQEVEGEDGNLCKQEVITTVYLLDVIFDRLEKMNRERTYCNRFMKDVVYIEGIRAKIEIVDEHFDVVKTLKPIELTEQGYPGEDTVLRSYREECNGLLISQELTKKNA
ncbi:HD domain-containing protein [Acinetobacter courvalinii]|uniref:HD domain-containing protein n=1 Tax=Acinetobacter courvalinii TaxID=280147 RepID=UPI00190190BD|nr:hypothetical protein [Acinetobacter courvalinii]MBJ9957585.1 hypothetical protein [Acinetobacter courvalinii]